MLCVLYCSYCFHLVLILPVQFMNSSRTECLWISLYLAHFIVALRVGEISREGGYIYQILNFFDNHAERLRIQFITNREWVIKFCNLLESKVRCGSRRPVKNSPSTQVKDRKSWCRWQLKRNIEMVGIFEGIIWWAYM